MGNKVILLVYSPSSHVASRGLRNFLYNDFQLNVQELRLQARFFKGLVYRYIAAAGGKPELCLLICVSQ